MLSRILLTTAMVLLFNLLSLAGVLKFLLYLTAYLIIGSDILKKAGKGIWNHRMFDENFLMAVATIGAFILAVYSGSSDYNEAIAVMLFYQIGEFFQSYAGWEEQKKYQRTDGYSSGLCKCRTKRNT